MPLPTELEQARKHLHEAAKLTAAAQVKYLDGNPPSDGRAQQLTAAAQRVAEADDVLRTWAGPTDAELTADLRRIDGEIKARRFADFEPGQVGGN